MKTLFPAKVTIEHCPSCGSSELSANWVETEIEYGSDPTVLIPVCHPVHECGSCEEMFLNHVAEELRDGAVKRYQTGYLVARPKP